MERLLALFFDKDTEEENIWKSRKKKLGVGTGDDSRLVVLFDEGFTWIWWEENRGTCQTIFDGKITEENDLLKLFEMLGVREWLEGQK